MTDSPPPDYGHSPTPGKPPSGGGVREVTKDMPQFSHHPTVIPAQAGIQQRADFFAGIAFYTADAAHWIPVFTGMTLWVWQALNPSSPHIVTLGLDPRAHDPPSRLDEGRVSPNLPAPHADLWSLHHRMGTRVKPEYDDRR